MKVGDHYEEEIQISEAAVAAYGRMTGDSTRSTLTTPRRAAQVLTGGSLRAC